MITHKYQKTVLKHFVTSCKEVDRQLLGAALCRRSARQSLSKYVEPREHTEETDLRSGVFIEKSSSSTPQ